MVKRVCCAEGFLQLSGDWVMKVGEAFRKGLRLRLPGKSALERASRSTSPMVALDMHECRGGEESVLKVTEDEFPDLRGIARVKMTSEELSNVALVSNAKIGRASC